MSVIAAGAFVGWAAPAALAYSPLAHLVGVRRRLAPAAIHGQRSVALTFDDGPQAGVTDGYLDLLGDMGVRATFFVVGEQAERCPETVQRMVAEGHEVCNHGYRHRDHFLRGPIDIMRDIERGAQVIERLTGRRPEMYRPPQGVMTTFTRVAAHRAGQPVVLWSRWARDWRRRATAATIHDEATTGVVAGDVLLLHDADHYSMRTWHATREATPRIIETLRSRGLEPGPIGGVAALV